MAYRGPFDGFHATEASVSKTCLVRFDNNRYSVAARAVGRPVDVRAYADRIVTRQDGEIVAEHPRRLVVWRAHERATDAARSPTSRGTTCRSCSASRAHCVTARPSRTGSCPTPSADCEPGSRPATTATGSSSRCSRRCWRTGWRRLRRPVPRRSTATLAAQTSCAPRAWPRDVLNILARQRQPAPPADIPKPEGLQLRHHPVADCQRYDSLREAGHGAS